MFRIDKKMILVDFPIPIIPCNICGEDKENPFEAWCTTDCRIIDYYRSGLSDRWDSINEFLEYIRKMIDETD